MNKSKEDILNTTGYLFLRKNAFTEALEIFELNTRLFPNKANPWDSLGEAHYKYGDKQQALIAFQKALSVKPGLRSAKAWVNRIQTELK